MVISESLAVIKASSRYIAHAELERRFLGLPRGESRQWGYEIAQVADDTWFCLVRAWGDAHKQLDGQHAGIKWACREMKPGGVAMVVLAPKKPAQYTLFRTDPAVTTAVTQRLLASCQPSEVEIREIATRVVGKPGNDFCFPAATVSFRIGDAGSAADALLTKGVGGYRAFGYGMVIDEECPLFPVFSALCS